MDIIKKYINKNRSQSVYIILVASFFGAYFLPINELLRGLVTLPGIGSMCYVLFQIFRDDWQYYKDIDIQNRQQNFLLSTSSHIAEVVYDKHVIFCEEYVERVQRGRQELFRDGASPNAMSIGTDLVRIRHRHSAWLTDEIENHLKPFEKTLIKIGSDENFLRMTASQGMDDRKKKIIDELFRSFGLVLGHEKALNDDEADIHIDKIIDKIRGVLGIKIMTELRSEAIQVAINRLKI